MDHFGAFDGSASYFRQTNGDGTVCFFVDNGREILWPGFNTRQPPHQAVQAMSGSIGPHLNPANLTLNHINGVPIQGVSFQHNATHNARPSEPRFFRPVPQNHITLPFRTRSNIPDTSWNRGVSFSSSVTTSNSSASPRSTFNNVVPSGNHGTIANANVIPDANTSTHTSAGAGTNTITSARSSNNLGGRTRFSCRLCAFSSKTHRDFDRHLATRAHLRKHGKQDSEETVTRYHCAVRGCRYASGKGFTRMDNLKRHERDRHTSR